MIVTSLTTIFSFLATGLSTIMPISAFGIFAAIAVFINYLEAILIMPAYIIIYEKFVKKAELYLFGLNCLKKCKKNKKIAENNNSTNL